MFERFGKIPGLHLVADAPLCQYTRFGIGGAAALLADARDEHAFINAFRTATELNIPVTVVGGGSNLVVSDDGFPGLVLRYTESSLRQDGTQVTACAGAALQHLVDFTIARGLGGLHTMTGIPGWVGGAVYGNAGAYGRSMDQNVLSVRFFDGLSIREFNNAECRFRYRDSTFKGNKGWVVFSTTVALSAARSGELLDTASAILATRNAKYPPEMKCAGSIFKNLLSAQLPDAARASVPPGLVREGKVPAAFFLEQVGAKGIRNGDIQVASYHANLIYNDGCGTAQQVREVIADLKARVHARFQFEIEEEVQYVGFPDSN